jgi:transposase
VHARRPIRILERLEEAVMVVFGIDAHKQSLAVAGVDPLGRQRCADTFPNDPAGHQALQAWVAGQAPEGRRVGIEGSGSFGLARARFLVAAGEVVVEVPAKLTDAQRSRMAGQGKSDERDALAIARAALREGDRLRPLGPELPGARELKLLVDYRRQLIGERTRTANRLHADLVVLCPGYEKRCGALRAAYQLRAAAELLAELSGVQAQLAARRLERMVELDHEIRTLGLELAERVRTLGTGLLELPGIGVVTAAQIIGEVRDPQRFATPDQFARANGTAPIPASSGTRTATASTAAATAASTTPCT